jgi:hypothetical protein
MKKTLLALIIAISLLKVQAQEENKEYEAKIVNDWLALPAQSNITKCSDLRLASAPAEDHGQNVLVLQADATVVVNGHKRFMEVTLIIYNNGTYRVATPPVFQDYVSPEQQAKDASEQQAKDAEEGAKLKKANEESAKRDQVEAETLQKAKEDLQKANEELAKQSALRDQVESKVVTTFKKRQAVLTSDLQESGKPTRLELSVGIRFVTRLANTRIELDRQGSRGFDGSVSYRLSDGLLERLSTFKEWAKKAKANGVTNFQKEMPPIDNSKVTFIVAADGTPTLVLASESRAVTLVESDIDGVSEFLSKLSADIATAQSGADAELAGLATNAEKNAKNAELFK